MTRHQMTDLKINGERLWADLMETAAIGGTPQGGVGRLALSEADAKVRAWFRARAESLGCTVAVDRMGTMFARRAGRRDMPPIAIGSHLDTQPTGGKFDGILGVLGALEALRTLVEGGYQTFAPIEVVDWTNEEGARFSPMMMASGVFAGIFDTEWAIARRDRAGTSVGEALAAIGCRGTEPCGHPLSAYFELHIEQGPVLEREGRDIGIVTGIQGIRWFEVMVRGEARHSGTTPMAVRRDALVGAARLVERVAAIAAQYAPLAVGTVGFMEVKPNSPNVVPGEVLFTIDLRHPDAMTLAAMEQGLVAAGFELADKTGLQVETRKIFDQAPVVFDPACIDSVHEAAAGAGLSAREIVSGAGHDAGYVAGVAPTAMVFVPCRDGISHNEAEHVSKAQCAAGAQVLLQAVLAHDRKLAARHGG